MMPVLISWMRRWDSVVLLRLWQRPRPYCYGQSDRSRKGRSAPRSAGQKFHSPRLGNQLFKGFNTVSAHPRITQGSCLPGSDVAAPALTHAQCLVAVPAAPIPRPRPLVPLALPPRRARTPRRFAGEIRHAQYRAHARAAVFLLADAALLATSSACACPVRQQE